MSQFGTANNKGLKYDLVLMDYNSLWCDYQASYNGQMEERMIPHKLSPLKNNVPEFSFFIPGLQALWKQKQKQKNN